jgi:hypothetical protein
MNTITNPFVRDSLSDYGQEPNNGALNVSPDIIPQQKSVNPNDVQSKFGIGSYNQDLGQQIEAGQTNYVYARANNPLTCAQDLNIALYWARPCTLQHPQRWNEIGTQPLNFDAKGVQVADKPFDWTPEQMPRVGHYCLISVITGEGLPEVPKSFATISDWWQFCRDHNSVAQRNIDIVDAKNDPIEKWLDIVNPDNASQLYQFEAVCNVPEGSKVSLFSPDGEINPPIDVRDRVISATNNEQTLYPHQGTLPANFNGSLQLTYVPSPDAKPGTYTIVVKQYLIQLQERKHVGSYTFEYKS